MKDLADYQDKKPDSLELINYTLIWNKDGKYSWRPLQIVHPAIYVSLVHKISNYKNWKEIKKRLWFMRGRSCVECLSMPIVSENKKSHRAEQIINWLEEVEKQSIVLALEYSFLFQTDIADCYGSIYSHSIPWAIHGKEYAKINRKEKNVWNTIDWTIQSMSNWQTNWIPQGSTLMDFIAEIVLCYADMVLTERLKHIKDDYRILRYRDDYRIFTQNPQIGEEILKNLTEVLIELWLKLNSQKTNFSDNVIEGSIKPDKYFDITKWKFERNISNELLTIHSMAEKFPNSWTIEKRLNKLYKRLQKTNKSWKIQNTLVQISIVADIILKNPRVYPIWMALISKLLVLINDENEKLSIISKLKNKFKQVPNTGFLDLWMQRVSIKIDRALPYNEPLCMLVNNKDIPLWNSNWLKKRWKIYKIIEDADIIDEVKISELDKIIMPFEVSYFTY